MIVNDQYKFAFIHIPKCGGTSVRSALGRFDDRNKIYFRRNVDSHPVLGHLDYAHIPLKVLQKYFPTDFSCLSEYSVFTLTRDPFERFASAVYQNIQMHPTEFNGDDALEQSVDRIMGHINNMSAEEPIIDPNMVHFCKQVDFVFLNGEKIVDNVFPLSSIDKLLAQINSITGAPCLVVNRENEGLRYAYKNIQYVDKIAQSVFKAIMPREMWKPIFGSIKKAYVRSGILKRWEDRYRDVFQSDHVQAFIKEYYADDIKLFNSSFDDLNTENRKSQI